MRWIAREHQFDFPRPMAVMGIVNTTPDSFSDGGQFLDTNAAEAHALRLAKEGAEILDIGGESTRPGAAEVSEQEELDRVIPVIERLAGIGTFHRHPKAKCRPGSHRSRSFHRQRYRCKPTRPRNVANGRQGKSRLRLHAHARHPANNAKQASVRQCHERS